MRTRFRLIVVLASFVLPPVSVSAQVVLSSGTLNGSPAVAITGFSRMRPASAVSGVEVPGDVIVGGKVRLTTAAGGTLMGAFD